MPELIYEASFKFDSLLSPNDPQKLGPLRRTQPPTVSSVGETPTSSTVGSADMKRVEPPGLKLTITRSHPRVWEKDDCYVGAVVVLPGRWPIPNHTGFLNRLNAKGFKIRATFEMPVWLEGDGDHRWAMVVFDRKGDAAWWPTRDERVTVTLQARRAADSPSAIMNTPGSTDGGTSAAIPARLYSAIFGSSLDGSMRASVTLELIVDRVGGRARSGLESGFPGREPPPQATWEPYAEHRWFTHPFTGGIPDGSVPPAEATESIGFAIANADGSGTATATVRSFQFYTLSAPELLLLRLQEWINRLFNR